MSPEYLFDYSAVLLAGVVGFAVVGLILTVSGFVAPRRKEALKGVTYECGMLPIERAEQSGWLQIHVRYYLFAILFLVFEAEAVFLFPWVVVLTDVGGAAFIEMMIFLAILLFGLVYAWKKGVLEWER